MVDREKDELLSRRSYDDDAASFGSATEPESDEDVGPSLSHRKRSRLYSQDAALLQEQEEHEELLSKPGAFRRLKGALTGRDANYTPMGPPSKDERRQLRRDQKDRRRRSRGDGVDSHGHVMFEMEEGFKDTSSQSSGSSLDLPIFGERQDDVAQPPLWRRLAWLWLLIALMFVGITFGAWRASSDQSFFGPEIPSTARSNGTSLFLPTTILLSLDGFRADFLDRDLTPALSAFIASGVSPPYMTPSFPSVTFPNHYTLMTGLYPESHGVVGNSFWDPYWQQEFFYTDPARSMDPKWWLAEPLWVTAEKQKVRSAVHMWPGSEAHLPPHDPTYLDKFNAEEPLTNKVDRILQLLDYPGEFDPESQLFTPGTKVRPQFIAAYVPNVDADGHLYGPNSTEIRSTIADVDSMLMLLMEGLYNRNLTEVVNLVVVSDHGMASTSTSRLIQLDELLGSDFDKIERIDGWPLRGIRLLPEFDNTEEYRKMHDNLLVFASRYKSFEVYTKENMPERYHFSNNDRIAPLWVIPETGYAVVEKPDYNVDQMQRNNVTYHPRGIHGYDHEHPLMRAIFVARGPAFPHPANSRVEPFQNIEVYNLICNSLGIRPLRNNGTLYLPLNPTGLHSDNVTQTGGNGQQPHNEIHPGHVPKPPIESAASDADIDQPQYHDHDDWHLPDFTEDPATSPTAEFKAPAGPGDGPETVEEAAKEALDSAAEAAAEVEADPSAEKSSWWDKMHQNLEKIKEWAKELMESVKGNKAGEGDKPV